jgi:rare lipoprotein A
MFDMVRLWLTALLLLSLVACGSTGKQDGPPSGKHLRHNIDIAAIPDAVPRVEAKSKYGNPDSYVVFGKRYEVMDSSLGYKKKGIASWYGSKFHGKRTSSGEPYDMYDMTAAHKTLPLPTYVKVTNLDNNRSVVLKVNDRGPFHNDRIIDLSYSAATKLGIAGNGTGLVEVVALVPEKKVKKANYKKVALVSGVPSKPVNLYVQIGAYSDRKNAQGVQLKLQRSKISNVKISQVDSPLRPLYRVRVGPINKVEHADSMLDELGKLGYAQAKIIVE